MKKYIYSADGLTLLRIEEAIPECGEDFCEQCGDCLDCYGGENCYCSDGEHFWVVYEKE